MNFASHYFFQGGSSDLFNAGLIFADLIPLSRSTPFPLMPAVKLLLNDSALPSAHRMLFEGIHSHFAADVIFHRSDFFHTAVNESIRIAGGSGGIPAPLHHILVELHMDRYLVINDPVLVTAMYDSFERCFNDSMSVFSRYLPLDAETVLLFERFLRSRTVAKYDDFAVIAEILTAIGIRVRIPYSTNEGMIPRIEQTYYALQTSISGYFEKSKSIFRNIASR
jgi:hypothetical protein